MVARINTVAFSGISVQRVGVQVQISNRLLAFTNMGYIKLLVLFIFAVIPMFLMPATTKADDVFKQGYMTCDENGNRALIRFNTTYSDTEIPYVDLTGIYETYENLNTNEFKKECFFKDGRRIKFSNKRGQPQPYGHCGGDPGTFFTLTINDEPVFYNKVWSQGACSYAYDPFVVILDEEKLISCAGPKDKKTWTISEYAIPSEDCVDTSERLKGVLSSLEERSVNWDKKVNAYQEILGEELVCEYFSHEVNRQHIRNDMYFIDLIKPSFPVKKIFAYIGDLSYSNVDINNDGQDDVLYRLQKWTSTFQGTAFFYFSNAKEKDDFLECALNDECPDNISKYIERRNTKEFLGHIADVWPSVNIITAKNSGISFENIGWQSFDPPSEMHPYIYKGQRYLYINTYYKDTLPQAVLMRIGKDDESETICTYAKD